MVENKWTALTGSQNKRLNEMDLRNSQVVDPLVDTQIKHRVSGVTLPPEEDVEHAKEWVDDGSLL